MLNSRGCFYSTIMQDPLADGPTIQAAATRALAAGCTLNKVRPLLLEECCAKLSQTSYLMPGTADARSGLQSRL